ncbi:MAG: heme-binding protein [Treponema sp.]|nr:heme-binding protein [Treponema sp.]
MMDIDQGIGILEKQEEELQFSHFNRQDVWKLGKELVAKVLDNDLQLAVSIRLLNGFTLFQYAPEGTNRDNEYWLNKKYNTVRDLDVSSLLFSLRLKKINQNLQSRSLDPMVYAWGGGGFPIRVRGTGMVAVAIASGLPHLQDHDVLVESIAKVLRLKDAARLPLDAGF